MSNKGWIKTYRDQFNSWISKKPFCDGYAWTYLYAKANHKKGMVNFRNEYISVERGQFLTSKLKLQKKYGWTYRHVENFLKALKNDENITYRTTNRYIVITIVNYNKYQGSDEQNGEQNEEQVKNRLGTDLERGNTNKNVKNDKNVKKDKGIIFTNTLQEYKKMRKTKKKPMTEKAISMLLNKLDKITTDNNEQIKIMEQSIFHCWDSVYPLKEEKQNKSTLSPLLK